MKVSDIKLYEVIDKLGDSSTVKVTFNGTEIYNDYDSTTEVYDGVYGEIYPLSMVAADRIKDFKDSIVNSIEIEVVDFHHSIVKIRGKYHECE
jgi:hypothetical protein